jgi:hypothetical protein
MIDVEQTIIVQYSNSPTIRGLIEKMNEFIDPRADIDDFFAKIFDIETAVGYGLDRIGRIVDVTRYVLIDPTYENFGFAEATDYFPFDDGVFWDGVVPEPETFALADDEFRRLLYVKCLANITNCSARAYNQMLNNFFAGRGRCYVCDTGNMSMHVTFEFLITPTEKAVFTQSGAFPRPAGVYCSALVVDGDNFGFFEAGDALPFDDGTFLGDTQYYAIS